MKKLLTCTGLEPLKTSKTFFCLDILDEDVSATAFRTKLSHQLPGAGTCHTNETTYA